MATASGGNSYERLPGEVSIPMDSMLSQTSETEARDDVDAKLEKVHSAYNSSCFLLQINLNAFILDFYACRTFPR